MPIARYKTDCSACLQPIWPGEEYEGYGQRFDRTKGTTRNAWYHTLCLDELIRKAEVAAKMAAAPMPSGRRSRKTRKGWVR